MASPTLGSCVLLALVSLAACGGGKAAPAATPAAAPLDTSSMPPSTKAETKTDPALAACHNAYKPASADKDVASDVAAMASGCADATKMKKVGATLSGKAGEKMPPVTFPLAAQGGKCYRVYGMSQSTMQDFDVSIIDSSGGLVGQDTTDDVSPVISEDGKVCYKAADSSTIRASAGAGAGTFALEVWSD
jgi:hypothetical protein